MYIGREYKQPRTLSWHERMRGKSYIAKRLVEYYSSYLYMQKKRLQADVDALRSASSESICSSQVN